MTKRIGSKDKEQRKRVKRRNYTLKFSSVFDLFLFCFLQLSILFLVGCAEIEKPKTEPFYAETAPPQRKEFRWINGKIPKSFDPALAAASPETDIIRAIFEGLTDTNPQTLEPVPAIAVKWESSEDFRVWTFHLRKDAKWSNGKPVIADDFVRSWKRLAGMETKVPHHKLLQNIAGVKLSESEKESLSATQSTQKDIFADPPNQNSTNKQQPNSETAEFNKTSENGAENRKVEVNKFGVVAVDNWTLKVALINPDKDFPALVAHPIFRPIYVDEKAFEGEKLNPAIVTNGAFRISSVGQEGITLDRSDNFWNREKIELERVRFVSVEDAEKALQFYREGEVDAVTNVDFAPLVLKLLEPYDDFHRTTHAALNFYEFNLENAPFNDRRVREALAISIERELLTEGTTEGATRPALSFFPFEPNKNKLTQDTKAAKKLLADAGFPDGKNFPKIRLVINRNDTQQRIARSVKKMWEENLNIGVEILVKEAKEIEEIVKTGDFDILRRGEVFPVADETANLLSMFPPKEMKFPDQTDFVDKEETTEPSLSAEAKIENNSAILETEEIPSNYQGKIILTEEQAIEELPAIPLYFPTSYSLVKPYVKGFETNTLDAPSLKNVKIDLNWRLERQKEEF